MPYAAFHREEWSKLVELSPYTAQRRYTLAGTAVFGPEPDHPWGLTLPAYLAELEVNAGKGSTGGLDPHFVVTAVKILDGTPVFPWRLAKTLDRLRSNYNRFIDDPQNGPRKIFERKAEEFERDQQADFPADAKDIPDSSGTERRDDLYVSWNSNTRTATFLFETTFLRTQAYSYQAADPPLPDGGIPERTVTRTGRRSTSVRARMEFEVAPRKGARITYREILK